MTWIPRAFADAWHAMDNREQTLTGHTLTSLDLTYEQRVWEVHRRLIASLNVDGPPSLELIEQSGAHLMALYSVALEAHTTDIAAGEAA